MQCSKYSMIYLEPQTTSLKWMFGETTIFHVKIWFIIQLKQPLKYGCLHVVYSNSYAMLQMCSFLLSRRPTPSVACCIHHLSSGSTYILCTPSVPQSVCMSMCHDERQIPLVWNRRCYIYTYMQWKKGNMWVSRIAIVPVIATVWKLCPWNTDKIRFEQICIDPPIDIPINGSSIAELETSGLSIYRMT